MMELLLNLSNTDMEYNYSIMEINIKDNIKWVNFMEKEDMFGKMGLLMMVILMMEEEKV
jgi:hypothetical protein